jgi:alanine racemase
MSICPNAMNDERPGIETARLTIDPSAIAANWRRLRELSPSAETGAVVKADAYGMGAIPIARALWDAGCRTYFVVFPQEGIALRGALPDARILVFSGLTAASAPFFTSNALTPMINSENERRAWIDHTRQAGRPVPCGLNFDTGMNRLGFEPGEAERLAADREGMELVLVSSHLACADDREHPLNQTQLDAFSKIAACFPGVRRSLANSPGVLLGRDYHFELTRPGIALHGGEAGSAGNNLMQPVATFEARILQIRSARKGETVGYGATHVLSRDSRIAICAAGYADGIRRSMSGAGPNEGEKRDAIASLGGRKVPIIGRVSMDLVALDVTDLQASAVTEGAWVEFFGRHIPLDDFARSAGTIAYEALTSIGNRVTRRYIPADIAFDSTAT